MSPANHGLEFPPMIEATQELARAPLGDPAAALDRGIDLLPHGGRVAVAVGSRRIEGLPALLALIAERLGGRGCRPFIVPAMGSHGGATAGGQERMLAGLGITEDSTGMPVESSMEVVALGSTPGGAEAFVDRAAYESDAIVVVNRVGPHTGYSGPVQSGVVKMLAVGLGKEAGASALHRHGFSAGHLIGEVADLVLENGPPVTAVALVEDGVKELSRLEVLVGGEMREREPELLASAVSMWPRLPVDSVDILVVEEIGKDISGIGMDPMVTGRGKETEEGAATFNAKLVVALRLTPQSAGNATGVGHADVITGRLLADIDFEAMKRNVNASGALHRARIPSVAASDAEALSMALASLEGVSSERARVVRIKNTRQLSTMQVSGPVASELEAVPGVTLGARATLEFDSEGNLLPPGASGGR